MTERRRGCSLCRRPAADGFGVSFTPHFYLDISAVWEVKRSALAEHKSRLGFMKPRHTDLLTIARSHAEWRGRRCAPQVVVTFSAEGPAVETRGGGQLSDSRGPRRAARRRTFPLATRPAGALKAPGMPWAPARSGS